MDGIVALSPAAWSMVQQVGRLLLASLFYVVIAGLLTPDEVGVLGIATVWLAFLGIFADLGFGAALVQRREITDRHLTTIFLLNLALGVLLALVGAAASWPISRLMRTPEAQPVMLTLSAGFVVNALATVQVALATRHLRFRALAVRGIGGVLAGGIVGIVLAATGWGVWSMVAQMLTTGVVGTALLWKLSPYRPRLRHWSRDAAKDLWGYSSRLFALSVFKYVVQNADALLIGYIFGPARLGLYALVNKVVLQPITALEAGVGGFLFPRASRLQDDRRRVADLYAVSYKALNYLVLPFVAVAGVWGGILVPAILGPEWRGAEVVFYALAVIGLTHPPITPVGQLMKALDRPGWFLRWGVGFSLATITGLLAGSRFGFAWALVGLASAYLAVLPVNFFIVTRLLPGSLSMVFRTVAPSYLAGGLLALVLLSSRVWGGDHVGFAVGSIGVGLLLYGACVWYGDPSLASLLRRQFAGLRAA